jgi:superfamily II RNA helicase
MYDFMLRYLFKQATPEEQAAAANKGKDKKTGGGAKNVMDASGLKKIVDMIMKRNLYPAIVFSFSKKVSNITITARSIVARVVTLFYR